MMPSTIMSLYRTVDLDQRCLVVSEDSTKEKDGWEEILNMSVNNKTIKW
jgi:hypothetical protein